MKALSKLIPKTTRRQVILFFGALLCALVTASSAAQAQTSRITGRTIGDFPEGKRALPNVPITLVNPNITNHLCESVVENEQKEGYCQFAPAMHQQAISRAHFACFLYLCFLLYPVKQTFYALADGAHQPVVVPFIGG